MPRSFLSVNEELSGPDGGVFDAYSSKIPATRSSIVFSLVDSTFDFLDLNVADPIELSAACQLVSLVDFKVELRNGLNDLRGHASQNTSVWVGPRRDDGTRCNYAPMADLRTFENSAVCAQPNIIANFNWEC